jgi:hypothetical protein
MGGGARRPPMRADDVLVEAALAVHGASITPPVP